MADNLYDILGVKKDASEDDIRRAYRKLARKHHPDVNPGDAKAEEAFKKVSAANDVLSDAKKRAAYDEFGDEALQGNFDADRARANAWQRQRGGGGGRPFGGGGAGFGGGRGVSDDGYQFDLGDLFGQARGPRRGRDLHAEVEVDLRQAIDGIELTLDVGGQPLRVRIPPGADEGSKVRLRGKGAPGGQGGPAGDLVIETHVRAHPHVRRDGLDLYMVLPVTVDEAYNGAAIDVPTFDGAVTLRVPPRSQNGGKLRLRGKGVKRGEQRGDWYVELNVRMPDKADEALAAALREAGANGYSAPVRAELSL